MITKKFHLNSRDFDKLYDFIVKSKGDFNKSVTINASGVRLFIFHSDLAVYGVNRKQIAKFKKLYAKGKVDAFCCCCPNETGIDMRLCFMGRYATGEISHSGDSDLVIFSCEESI